MKSLLHDLIYSGIMVIFFTTISYMMSDLLILVATLKCQVSEFDA